MGLQGPVLSCLLAASSGGALTSALLPLFMQGLQSSLPSIREGRGTEQQLAKGVTQMEQQESATLAGGLALVSLSEPSSHHPQAAVAALGPAFWPPLQVLALACSSIVLGLVWCFVRLRWESLGLR